MTAIRSLTVHGISGPGIEPSCLGTACIHDGTGVEIGGFNVDAFVVAITVVGARLSPTTGAMLSGKMLESMELLNNNQRNVHLLTLHGYQSLNPRLSTMM